MPLSIAYTHSREMTCLFTATHGTFTKWCLVKLHELVNKSLLSRQLLKLTFLAYIKFMSEYVRLACTRSYSISYESTVRMHDIGFVAHPNTNPIPKGNFEVMTLCIQARTRSSR
jgi:hypothetical protein